MYNFSETAAFGGFDERKQIDSGKWKIINVSSRQIDDTSVFVPLNDGVYDGGNEQEEFDSAVTHVTNALQEEEPVFVHCAVGQSRSVAVLATALTLETDKSFEQLRDELMKIRGSFTEPAPSLQEKARIHLRCQQE